jgi:predicted alpha/beta superfamily hydrolase
MVWKARLANRSGLVTVETRQAVIPAGEQITIRSELLAEDRTVFVALPVSYRAGGTERYPVLYLTDAQWNFGHAWTSTQLLARNVIIPDMIVVGVVNRDRTRDLYATRADFKAGDRVIPFPTSGNADRFLEFFARELIPWTEKTYRTSELRVLAGHSAGGNFALHAARLRPELFQAVMVTSPWLAWDDRKELKQLLPFVRSTGLRLRALFVSRANEGAEISRSWASSWASRSVRRSRSSPSSGTGIWMPAGQRWQSPRSASTRSSTRNRQAPGTAWPKGSSAAAKSPRRLHILGRRSPWRRRSSSRTRRHFADASRAYRRSADRIAALVPHEDTNNTMVTKSL